MNLQLLKGVYIEERFNLPLEASVKCRTAGCDREGPRGLFLPRGQSEPCTGAATSPLLGKQVKVGRLGGECF